MSIFFYYNDKQYKQGTPIIEADNRSFRYGDGLFETMKMVDGEIILSEYHFERLFKGVQVLQFDIPKHFTEEYLIDKIKKLCKKNCHQAARVRLTITRGNGGLYDAPNNLPNYIIESWEISNEKNLNSNGLVIDVYPDVKKSCDKFSNLKSNNFLPYVMAALFAKANKLNDALVLNSYDRVCDTTIANVFMVKDEKIFTPLLSEGCVAGVTRSWLLQNLNDNEFKVTEKEITPQEVLEADELFLTNSIFDIKWVKQCGNKVYNNTVTSKIHDQYIKSIY